MDEIWIFGLFSIEQTFLATSEGLPPPPRFELQLQSGMWA
jgi:hypothetical protein